jgi:segregation and condensation protein A
MSSSSPSPEPAARVSPPDPVEGNGYRVRLDEFEGPLDLLLHLIREEEVDIYDIPIARITDQYLDSIGDVETLDLDRAGEYLLMAATLMRIKAKMLIPRDPEEEEEEEIDPRAELVRRLLEYREFKRIAEDLGDRQEAWRGVFGRGVAALGEDDGNGLVDPGISLIDIFRAFRGVLDRMERDAAYEMETEEYSVDEQMEFIRSSCLRAPEGLPFSRLFEGVRSRNLVITTFLALLELIREREILAVQAERFGEIWLRYSTEVTGANEP